MKKSSTRSLIFTLFLLSACANQYTQTRNTPPPTSTPKQSNAEMAENFSNAVQRCVGMGLTIGSAPYETCVKNQLK